MKPTATPPAFSLGAVVLAAGRSTRMGRPKLLLPWEGTSILGHLLAQWRQVGATQIAVVCAGDNTPLQGELARLESPAAHCVYNPAPDRGMFSSIQSAAQWPGWQAGLTHFAIVLGDQPHLRLGTLQAVLAWAQTHPQQVCQPAYQGKPRHPVVLPRMLFAELACSSRPTLKAFLAEQTLALCEVEDAGLDWDIDWPQDYLKALAGS